MGSRNRTRSRRPRRLELELVDAQAAQDWLTGYLAGAVIQIDGLDVTVEPHEVGDRLVPSFEAHIGRHVLIVHIDQAIA